MKSLLIVAGVVILVAQITVRQADASEGFEDLVKVVKSGADDKALAAYIDASPVTYDLTVDEILYLNDLGLSAEMIKAVTAHGKKSAEGVVEPPPPVPEPVLQPPAEEQPPAVSLPPAEDSVQETVVDAPDVTAPPADDADVSSFYGALLPYGSWVNVDGVWCWQPTAMVVDSSWSPYCQRGHWVYTDCGWMWQSDYSWGWAPFHYGRWGRHARFGWIWHPDNVWGPAWVSWRNSNAAIGWAPLPPEARYEAGIGFSFRGRRVGADFEFGLEPQHFTFVPIAHFSERALERSRLPRSEVTRTYNTTSIIQNNYTYNDNRITNRGPAIARIQDVTHQVIKQVKIVDQNLRPGQPIRRGAIAGEAVAVYRPHLAPTTHETPKAVVARREASVQVRHEEARQVPVIETYKSSPAVQAEQVRGRASLEAARTGATPHNPPRAPVPTAANQQQLNDAADRQRQAEEAAARQREQQQQQAAEFARQQEQKRNAEVLAQQQTEQQRRNAALAQEQQQRATELARQQELQQQRAQEQVRQQEAQQRAEEQSRQQELQQQRAQQQARQQEEQERAWQAQRQAEESAARQREQQQQQAVQQRAQQQSAFQGYGNNSMTNAASNRGADSRRGR